MANVTLYCVGLRGLDAITYDLEHGDESCYQYQLPVWQYVYIIHLLSRVIMMLTVITELICPLSIRSQDNHLLAKPSVYSSIPRRDFSYAAPQIWNWDAIPLNIRNSPLVGSFKHNLKQESCAIAKMTARSALYKWIEWAVAEIWPFEIIQDGGLPPTWIWCNRK